MAFLTTFMIILNLYSDLCFGQNLNGMGSTGESTGFKCTKCVIGAKARESICSDCSRDNADKPFTCRRCNIGTSAQPFLCRSCTNSNPNINSCECDGLTTATAPNPNDNASVFIPNNNGKIFLTLSLLWGEAQLCLPGLPYVCLKKEE